MSDKPGVILNLLKSWRTSLSHNSTDDGALRMVDQIWELIHDLNFYCMFLGSLCGLHQAHRSDADRPETSFAVWNRTSKWTQKEEHQ
jgi:hypothetical protein